MLKDKLVMRFMTKFTSDKKELYKYSILNVRFISELKVRLNDPEGIVRFIEYKKDELFKEVIASLARYREYSQVFEDDYPEDIQKDYEQSEVQEYDYCILERIGNFFDDLRRFGALGFNYQIEDIVLDKDINYIAITIDMSKLTEYQRMNMGYFLGDMKKSINDFG